MASEFRNDRGESDSTRVQERLQEAKDYAFLIYSVREHKVGSEKRFERGFILCACRETGHGSGVGGLSGGCLFMGLPVLYAIREPSGVICLIDTLSI